MLAPKRDNSLNEWKIKFTELIFELFKNEMIVNHDTTLPWLNEEAEDVAQKIKIEIDIIYKKIYSINHIFFYILKKMQPESMWVLLKTFIYHKGHRDWYREYYISKYQFYKARKRAIEEFVGYYIGCNQHNLQY